MCGIHVLSRKVLTVSCLCILLHTQAGQKFVADSHNHVVILFSDVRLCKVDVYDKLRDAYMLGWSGAGVGVLCVFAALLSGIPNPHAVLGARPVTPRVPAPHIHTQIVGFTSLSSKLPTAEVFLMLSNM
jgi:hypothetical protein